MISIILVQIVESQNEKDSPGWKMRSKLSNVKSIFRRRNNANDQSIDRNRWHTIYTKNINSHETTEFRSLTSSTMPNTGTYIKHILDCQKHKNNRTQIVWIRF